MALASTFSTFVSSAFAAALGSDFLTGSATFGFSVVITSSIGSASVLAAFLASSFSLILAKMAGSSTTAFPAKVRGWSSCLLFAVSGTVLILALTVFSAGLTIVSVPVFTP